MKIEKTSLSFWQVLISTLAAFFGVQSEANRQRDFSDGKLSQFILMGAVMTLVLIGMLVGVVFLVLSIV